MRVNPCLLLLLLPLACWPGPGAAQAQQEKETVRVQATPSVRAVQPAAPATTAKPIKPATAARLRMQDDIRLQPRAIGRDEAFERELGASNGVRFEQLQSMRRQAERAAGLGARAVTKHVPQNKRDWQRHPGDCNDRDPAVNPGQPEVCNFKDDNCDGDVDEGVTWTVWRDSDGDGFGDPRHPVQTCPVGEALADVSLNNRDCDDTDRSRNPALGTCP